MRSGLLLSLFLLLLCKQQSFSQVIPLHPEIFNEYISVRDLALNENEIYFSMQSLMNEVSAIIVIKKEKSKWTKAQVASFSGQYMDLEPSLSPDQLRLYFASNRPLNADSTAAKDFDIWYVERKEINSPWSEAKNLGPPVNTDENEFYPSLSSSATIYFTSDRSGSLGSDDIFMSKWDGTNYQEVINLGEKINSPGYEFNAYVSPDEKLILFTAYNREDGLGSGDLYYSRKNDNGEWTEAKNLGPEINSDKMDYCPFYDAANSILYFTSRRSSIVPDTSKKHSIEELEKEINKYENGLSRIYQVNINLEE